MIRSWIPSCQNPAEVGESCWCHRVSTGDTFVGDRHLEDSGEAHIDERPFADHVRLPDSDTETVGAVSDVSAHASTVEAEVVVPVGGGHHQPCSSQCIALFGPRRCEQHFPTPGFRHEIPAKVPLRCFPFSYEGGFTGRSSGEQSVEMRGLNAGAGSSFCCCRVCCCSDHHGVATFRSNVWSTVSQVTLRVIGSCCCVSRKGVTQPLTKDFNEEIGLTPQNAERTGLSL